MTEEPAVLIEGSVSNIPPHVMVPSALPTPEQILRAETTAGQTLKIVVMALATVAILSLLLVSALAFFDKETPAGLIAIGSGASGALATLVARVGRLNGQGIG